jgi:indole-3-glycerol phosphate synthase
MIINRRNVEFIAEVKTMSPFGYKSKDSWDGLFELANRVGDIVAVHTHKDFDGSFELLGKARGLTDKLIMAKGYHYEDYEIKRAIDVVDYALAVGRVPRVYLDRCLIEPVSLNELQKIPKWCMVVWNSRDLSNGCLKKETFEQARNIWKGWLCQASNIRTINDVKEGADAVLVGEHLREFAESLNEK